VGLYDKHEYKKNKKMAPISPDSYRERDLNKIRNLRLKIGWRQQNVRE